MCSTDRMRSMCVCCSGDWKRAGWVCREHTPDGSAMGPEKGALCRQNPGQLKGVERGGWGGLEGTW